MAQRSITSFFNGVSRKRSSTEVAEPGDDDFDSRQLCKSSVVEGKLQELIVDGNICFELQTRVAVDMELSESK